MMVMVMVVVMNHHCLHRVLWMRAQEKIHLVLQS
jgi:hypothetical protein